MPHTNFPAMWDVNLRFAQAFSNKELIFYWTDSTKLTSLILLLLCVISCFSLQWHIPLKSTTDALSLILLLFLFLTQFCTHKRFVVSVGCQGHANTTRAFSDLLIVTMFFICMDISPFLTGSALFAGICIVKLLPHYYNNI